MASRNKDRPVMSLRRSAFVLILALAGPCARPALAEPSLPPAVSAFLRDDLGLREYRTAATDLNGDGAPEFVVLAEDRESCGTGGCTMFVLSCPEARCRVILRAPIVRPPIRVLETATGGWRDLAVVRSGGGAPPSMVKLRFNPPGREDAPPEAVPLDGEAARGTAIIR